MREITVKEFANFLNNSTNGFSCPICRRQEWQVEQSNGKVSRVKLIAGAELENALGGLISDYGGNLPEKDNEEDKSFESNLITDLVIVRCRHCGWLAFFHRKLIEEKIHGEK